MVEVIWTDSALENVEEIAGYIALSNPAAAAQLIQSLISTIERLKAFPRSGRIPTELERLDYREVVVNPCRVFYKIAGRKVYIVHVLRQENDIRRYLLGSPDG